MAKCWQCDEHEVKEEGDRCDECQARTSPSTTALDSKDSGSTERDDERGPDRMSII